MYQAKSRLTLSIISFVSLLTLFCGDPVPVKEMGQAKTSIAKAEFAKADKYSPEEYKQAKDTLFASHDLISKGEYKDAKEKAKEAEALARKAFEGAETKGKAEKAKSEAKTAFSKTEESYSKEFTKAEYKNVQDLIASGDKKFDKGEYEKAYADYEEAKLKIKCPLKKVRIEWDAIEQEKIRLQKILPLKIFYQIRCFGGYNYGLPSLASAMAEKVGAGNLYLKSGKCLDQVSSDKDRAWILGFRCACYRKKLSSKEIEETIDEITEQALNESQCNN